MKEQRTQYELITWFSQTYPEYRCCLFAINNESNSVQNAIKMRSMGVIRGVSDLGFISPSGVFAGIEIKAIESRHNADHIREQLSWGDVCIKNGCNYLMAYCIEDLKDFIIALIESDYLTVTTLQSKWYDYVENKLNEGKKTIKFD